QCTDTLVRSLAVALLSDQHQVRWFDDIGYCHCDLSKCTHLLPMSFSGSWNTSWSIDITKL
ncbi:hypothetical protein GGH92_006842, partial [Coemansia sp. RSA 2673]